ncbi:MAG: hypothetical protein ACOYJK_00250 [Prevotella sp.]
MKRLVLIFAIALSTLQVCGHEHSKFDPKRFEVELEQFIATEAALSPQEASAFFPVYKEMQRKQRVLFSKLRRYRHIDTSDDKASLEAIKAKDEIELEIKELQQQYHMKFCKMMSAGKVLRIIKAEEKFHRQAFRRAARRR